MRMRQPPNGLVDIYVLQTETDQGKDKHHALKDDIAISWDLWNVGMFRLYDKQC